MVGPGEPFGGMRRTASVAGMSREKLPSALATPRGRRTGRPTGWRGWKALNSARPCLGVATFLALLEPHAATSRAPAPPSRSWRRVTGGVATRPTYPRPIELHVDGVRFDVPDDGS